MAAAEVRGVGLRPGVWGQWSYSLTACPDAKQPFLGAFAVSSKDKQALTGIPVHSGHLKWSSTHPFRQVLSLWKIQNIQVTPGCFFFFLLQL